MAQTVTLSSAGTATIVLDPVAKSTTVQLTTTAGTSAATITVEMSLDDPTLPGGPSMTWSTLSSAAAINSSQSGSLTYTVLSPIGAVRLNSTTNNAATASWTLKALQSETA